MITLTKLNDWWYELSSIQPPLLDERVSGNMGILFGEGETKK